MIVQGMGILLATGVAMILLGILLGVVFKSIGWVLDRME